MVERKSSHISIPDEFVGHSLNKFLIPSFYKEDLNRVLIPEGMIIDRVKQLCAEVHQTVGDNPLTVLCVLKGSFKFFTVFNDHLSALRYSGSHPLLFDFIRLQSYTDTKSTGTIKVVGGNPLSALRGKNVLIVEDLLDTGKTMKHLLALLNEHEPATVHVAALLVKRNPNSTGYRPQFYGFEIPDEFIVGFGMDFNEYYRDLPHICVINQRGIDKYSVNGSA